MNEKGSQNFIKLDRQILENAIMDDSISFHLFVYCILKAEWQPVNDKGVFVPRGSFMTTIRQMAKDLRCSYRSVKTRLTTMSNHKYNYLSKLRIGNRLMITVVHYDKWQGAVQPNVQLDVPENASLPIKEKEYKNIKKEAGTTKWET